MIKIYRALRFPHAGKVLAALAGWLQITLPVPTI